MKTQKFVDLYYHNTMRLHCIADEVVYPESLSELKEIVTSGNDYAVIGGCSNIVFPPKLHKRIVSLEEMYTNIEFRDGLVICGSSIKIAKLIKECQKRNLGGIEYLISVPCSVGGAIFQNAGRGKNYHQTISNYIEWVECLNCKSGLVEMITKEQCQFDHRESLFKKDRSRIILRACFKFITQEQEISERYIKERLNYSKMKLDSERPSCGSVFSSGNGRIFNILKGLRIGGAKFSSKTANWISNIGGAKQWQIILLVYIAIILHIITFRKYKVEIEIWR